MEHTNIYVYLKETYPRHTHTHTYSRINITITCTHFSTAHKMFSSSLIFLHFTHIRQARAARASSISKGTQKKKSKPSIVNEYEYLYNKSENGAAHVYSLFFFSFLFAGWQMPKSFSSVFSKLKEDFPGFSLLNRHS